MLRTPGIGLGLVGPKMFNTRIAVESIELEPGDVLVLYSDGVTEAMNEVHEEYGDERLIRVIEERDGLDDAEALRDAIIADVQAFVGGAAPHDDMTVLVLRATA